MAKRSIGPFMVEPIGLGCMSLSHAYGRPPERADAARLLHHALDLGYDFLDTAALYGFGANEALIGDTLKSRRHEYVLASKCGLTAVDGKRVIDGRPQTLMRTVDESLARLQTEVIDLYYLHRRDFAVPIEESVGAMSRMVDAGKVRAIGLSEVSAATLARAQTEHPIAAVQTEYSPWSRNAEIAILDATRASNTAFVAFSPVARGFLAGAISTRDELIKGDIRLDMPRFGEENLLANLRLFAEFKRLAVAAGLTPAQLALGWGLAKAPHVVSIPGTTSVHHLEENFGSGEVRLSTDLVAEIDALINHKTVAGARYAPAAQTAMDTEEFASDEAC